jgi:hypothetical protein
MVKPLPAQGNQNPTPGLFNKHATVLWTAPPVAGQPGTYELLDPSYGASYSGSGPDFRNAAGILWEQAALANIRLFYPGGSFLDRIRAPGGPQNIKNCTYTLHT